MSYLQNKAFKLDIEKIGLTADGMVVKAECKLKWEIQTERRQTKYMYLTCWTI